MTVSIYVSYGIEKNCSPTLQGLSNIGEDGYMRKNAKGSFLSSDNRSKGILDLVHLDVCGLMSVSSLGGFLYYVTFIYDYSLKKWIFFMKDKDEFFSRFQEFRV